MNTCNESGDCQQQIDYKAAHDGRARIKLLPSKALVVCRFCKEVLKDLRE